MTSGNLALKFNLQYPNKNTSLVISRMASPTLQKVFEYIDENKQSLIDHLAECVSVKSVSAWPECRPQCQEMMDHVAKIIEDLGGTVEKCDVGMQTLADGSQIPLPNVLLGDIC